MSTGKTLHPWKMPGVWVWLIPLLLLGAGFIAFRSILSAPQKAETETVQLPQQVTVAALGRLEPEGEVITVGGPTGDRIDRLEVAEGDFVEQGTILAYLESYEERKAERDYAASQLTEAQNRLQAETQFGQAQIQEAQTRVQQVDRPELLEIQSQQATVRQLEAELSLAQTDLGRSQSLYQEGAISRQELDEQVTESRRVEEQLNSAKANLVRLETSRNMNMSNARAQVQSQQASLQRSQAQIEVESAARNLQLAEAKLDRTIIRAPQDGEVLRILSRDGEAISESGILELGNTRQMFVVAEVYETDVQRVRVGQQATITSRNGAFDQTLTGRVERIGSQIFKNNVLDDDPAANADARIVEVKIRLDNSETVAQLTNLQVDVRIDVE
ncbi:MAG: efflux RND transporter periplasmic adaptor subunit [Oculatellaceae cyanobacterium bins.114]|nr:efflux RND transporter periplasmic adaptor subunit [Oculatellaceae cyanobacterium bins.114]